MSEPEGQALAGAALPGAVLYDDPLFFAGYRDLRADGGGLNEDLEQPALAALLPDVHGARVLDLGCGDGALARRLAEAGAQEVIAVDASARMLAGAVPHPLVRYLRADIETLDRPASHTDLVVSSLALHYVRDYAGLIRRIAGWLRPGGLARVQRRASRLHRRPPHDRLAVGGRRLGVAGRRLRRGDSPDPGLARPHGGEVPPADGHPGRRDPRRRLVLTGLDEPCPGPAVVARKPPWPDTGGGRPC